MDLSTTYLGMTLPHPFMPGASVMSEDLGMIRRLEDAGAAAIVLHSLFEEQIRRESLATVSAMEAQTESHAEALSYLPSPESFRLGPDDYLEHLRRVKASVSVPVIGSLNGDTTGGWLEYAKLIQQAGADALELNVYFISTDLDERSEAIEQRTVDMVSEVKKAVTIPVAVKLSPFYASLPNVARRLVDAGADGLVLFNRFYQADIDIENLEAQRTIKLSTSSTLLTRLRWLAVLSGRIDASLAVTGGVHTGADGIKAIMCGAHAVQMVSSLLLNGPAHLHSVREQVAVWLEEHEYESLRQMQGSMNLLRCPDSHAYERANYITVLRSWRL